MTKSLLVLLMMDMV